ncbi:MAG TPA: sugar ABC transporter ATP-binding protein, partial [Rikenellaceae bacterium]|nr:sugar ABC transporter ATP-binding protein [Rikenellaceae bacterium]
LRMIAGLEEITSGKISIGGRVVNDVPPQDRDIAMVFQNYALYPHMSVYKNIAWPLEIRKMKTNEIKAAVVSLTSDLDIERLMDRMPGSLSGGKKQRVALARTLAAHPKVLLLDEPLSALDAPLREQSALLLKKVSQTGITILHVTHDQTEVSSLANRQINIGSIT